MARLIREEDAEGVELRRTRQFHRKNFHSPGPNYSCHVDGFDTLKPYGFAISGAIDWYSRRMLWLEVATTNSNPVVIAKYYLDYVKKLGAVPVTMRTDHGTENGSIAALQALFRSQHNDTHVGINSHQFSVSVLNQRIECWWSFFRRRHAEFWIALFNDFCDAGMFDQGTILHVYCHRWSFMSLLKKATGRNSDVMEYS